MRTTLLLFSFFQLSITLLSQSTQPALKITPLTGSFYIFTTYNQYKGTPVPANGMYLVTDKGVVVFDTPWDTTQFQPLLDSINAKHHQPVIVCIATHSHEDRIGGLEYYRARGIQTYTTKQTDDISRAQHQKRAQFLLSGDTTFSVGGCTFQTFYAGPGHAPDNIVIWFEKQKILYGGCLVKSTEATDLGYTGDANLKEWPITIQKIKQKFGKPKYIIPGHLDWKNNRSLEHTLKLLCLKAKGA